MTRHLPYIGSRKELQDFLAKEADPDILARVAAQKCDYITPLDWGRHFLDHAKVLNAAALRAINLPLLENRLIEIMEQRPSVLTKDALVYVKNRLLEDFHPDALGDRSVNPNLWIRRPTIWNHLVSSGTITSKSKDFLSWATAWIEAASSNPPKNIQDNIRSVYNMIAKVPNLPTNLARACVHWGLANDAPDIIFELRAHPYLTPAHVYGAIDFKSLRNYYNDNLVDPATLFALTDTLRWCQDPNLQPALIDAYFMEARSACQAATRTYSWDKKPKDPMPALQLGLNNLSQSIRRENAQEFLTHLIEFASLSPTAQSLFISAIPLLPKKTLSRIPKTSLATLFMHKDRQVRAMALMLAPYLKAPPGAVKKPPR